MIGGVSNNKWIIEVWRSEIIKNLFYYNGKYIAYNVPLNNFTHIPPDADVSTYANKKLLIIVIVMGDCKFEIAPRYSITYHVTWTVNLSRNPKPEFGGGGSTPFMDSFLLRSVTIINYDNLKRFRWQLWTLAATYSAHSI